MQLYSDVERTLEIVLESIYDEIYDTDKDYLYHGACGLCL